MRLHSSNTTARSEHSKTFIDPGSEYTAEVIKHLHQWLGMNQKFSLVDRHTSSGVEGTNKQLLRHLRALVHDERVGNKWSDPTILPLILYLVNSSHSSETGVTPMQAKFGSIDMTYHQLPEDTPSSEVTHD